MRYIRAGLISPKVSILIAGILCSAIPAIVLSHRLKSPTAPATQLYKIGTDRRSTPGFLGSVSTFSSSASPLSLYSRLPKSHHVRSIVSFDSFSSTLPQQPNSKIVFASNRDGSMQIYVMNGDGSGVARLTNSGANDDCPRWSPNGSKILFQSDRDHTDTGYMDVYVMNSDGSGITRLTIDANDDSMARWSPDGSQILFQSMRNGVKYQVYSMNADSSNQVNLTNSSSSDGEPSWSPDGTKIVFASDRDHSGYNSIYVMNSNGSNQQALTSSNASLEDTEPVWSPDGSKIAFVSTRDSTTETWQETDDDGNYITKSKLHINKEIYVMNADGSSQARLTNDPANDDSPSWSPLGLTILFRSDRDRECCDPTAQIWSMNADGSALTNLSSNNSGDSSSSGTMIDFSDNAAKDGSSISVDASASLVIINFDGLGPNIAVTNQYPQATFSSYPGGTVKTANDCSYLGSCPNGIIATSGFGSTFWPNADVYVNFAVPVNGLTFRVVGGQAGGAAGSVDVYVNNSYYGTTNFFTSIGFPGQVLPPVIVNLSAVQHITAIKIRNVDNCGDLSCIFRWPVYYDDFAFTPELNANITSPRIGSGQTGLDRTSQTSLVGARITLNSTVSKSGGTYSWDLTGTSYSIVSGCQSSSSCTIRPTNPGNINAKLTYTLGGVSVSPNLTINVILPSLTAFWGSESSDIVARDSCFEDSGVSYTLGCFRYEPDPPDGIIFHATAQIPSVTYLSDPAEGGIKFLQAANPYRKVLDSGNIKCFTARDNQDPWRRDGGDPYTALDSRYPPAHYFSEGNAVNMTSYDPPGFLVENPFISFDAAFVDDQFEDYVAYFTTDPTHPDPAHPIFQRFLNLAGSNHPYAKLTWHWGGEVQFNYNSTPHTLHYSLQSNTSSGSVLGGDTDNLMSMTIPAGTLAFNTCTGTTATANPIDGSKFFVSQLYWDFFNRVPDADGLNYWRWNITQCGFDVNCIGGTDPLPGGKRVDVARAFFYSTEFIGMHPELGSQRGTHDYNWSFVSWCYWAFLQRAPNAAPDNGWDGFNFWVADLDNTNPDAGDWKYNHIIKAFITSPEYRGRNFCASHPC